MTTRDERMMQTIAAAYADAKRRKLGTFKTQLWVEAARHNVLRLSLESQKALQSEYGDMPDHKNRSAGLL